MDKHLVVYYDNPTEASNMYLKMIKQDAEKYGVSVHVCDSEKAVSALVFNELYDLYRIPLLILQPTKENFDYSSYIFTNIDGDKYDSATALGIYNHIVGLDPCRECTIGVIGRGLVGKELIDLLITYGYTVIELNSKTNGAVFEELLSHCNIIVGLSSTDNIIDEDQKDMIEFLSKKVWIDAGHNFDFEDRTNVLKCGKWTREVLFDRIEEMWR